MLDSARGSARGSEKEQDLERARARGTDLVMEMGSETAQGSVRGQRMARARASKALHPQASGSRLWLDLLLQEL